MRVPWRLALLPVVGSALFALPAAAPVLAASGLARPTAVAVAADGTVFVADTGNDRVVTVEGDAVTVVLDEGLASPQGVAVAPDGTVFVADTGHDRVIAVAPDGGVFGEVAGLAGPQGLAIGSGGELLVADTGNDRVLRVRAAGTEVVATGLHLPLGVAAGPGGTVLVADSFAQRVVRIDAAGAVATIAGPGPTPPPLTACDGDGGPAVLATLSPPAGLAVAGGSVFVTDPGHHRIRRVSGEGSITSVVTGEDLVFPTSVAVDGDDLLVADAGADQVVRLAGAAGPTPSPSGRVAGADRFATAAAVAERFFEPGVDVALVATGHTFADALAGGATGHPVLLVTRDEVPAVTAAALQRLDPQNVVVLGGPAAVSDAVVAAVGGERVAGGDRYETAAAIAAELFPGGDGVEEGSPEEKLALVASGAAFPDALAAAALGHPVLLVEPGRVPPSTAAALGRLGADQVVVVGGPAAVSDAVLAEVGGTRVAGADRYATAAALSAGLFEGPVETALAATGADFPDGLAAGPAAQAAGGPVLLVSCVAVPPDVDAELDRLGPGTVTVVGGPAAVSDPVAVRLERSTLEQ